MSRVYSAKRRGYLLCCKGKLVYVFFIMCLHIQNIKNEKIKNRKFEKRVDGL